VCQRRREHERSEGQRWRERILADEQTECLEMVFGRHASEASVKGGGREHWRTSSALSSSFLLLIPLACSSRLLARLPHRSLLIFPTHLLP